MFRIFLTTGVEPSGFRLVCSKSSQFHSLPSSPALLRFHHMRKEKNHVILCKCRVIEVKHVITSWARWTLRCCCITFNCSSLMCNQQKTLKATILGKTMHASAGKDSHFTCLQYLTIIIKTSWIFRYFNFLTRFNLMLCTRKSDLRFVQSNRTYLLLFFQVRGKKVGWVQSNVRLETSLTADATQTHSKHHAGRRDACRGFVFKIMIIMIII